MGKAKSEVLRRVGVRSVTYETPGAEHQSRYSRRLAHETWDLADCDLLYFLDYGLNDLIGCFPDEVVPTSSMVRDEDLLIGRLVRRFPVLLGKR